MTFRKLSYVVALIIATSFAAQGCSKDEGSQGASKLANLPGGKSGFAIMDKNSNVVVGVNVSKLMGSGMWKKWGSTVKSQLPPEYNQFVSTCGWDPLEKIDSIIMAGNDKNDKTAVVVVKGISRGEAIECGKKAAAAEGKSVVITDEGNLTKIVGTDDKTGYIGWLDDKTAVIAPEQGEDKASMEAVMSGKGGLDGNKEIMGLLGNVDTKASIWGVYKNAGNAAGGPVEFSAAYGSVDVDTGVKLDIGMRQASADEASKTVEMAKKQLESFASSPMGKFVSKIEVKANDTDVIAQMSLTEAEIQELAMLMMSDPKMGMFMQKMMGGM